MKPKKISISEIKKLVKEVLSDVEQEEEAMEHNTNTVHYEVCFDRTWAEINLSTEELGHLNAIRSTLTCKRVAGTYFKLEESPSPRRFDTPNQAGVAMEKWVRMHGVQPECFFVKRVTIETKRTEERL